MACTLINKILSIIKKKNIRFMSTSRPKGIYKEQLSEKRRIQFHKKSLEVTPPMALNLRHKQSGKSQISIYIT